MKKTLRKPVKKAERKVTLLTTVATVEGCCTGNCS